MNETPKKYIGSATNCLLCSREVVNKEIIYIFGKSVVDLERLINLAVGIHLSPEGDNSRVFVCKKACYSKLIKLDNAIKQVDNLKSELYKQFKEIDLQGFKRLHPSDDCCDIHELSQDCSVATSSTPKVHIVPKSLRFSTDTNCTSTQQSITIDCEPIQAISFNIFNLLTSSPIKENISKSSPEVQIIIKYPSKTVRKVLDSEYESLGKALFYGQPLCIASAIMKCQRVCKFVISKVFDKLSNEVSGLCSRKNPSILRQTSKNELVNFKLESLCEEWKTRSPLFYSFLLTSSVTKRNASTTTWLPSMSLAGSILLKQRNGQMSATASVMGILIKTGSMEATLNRFTKLKLTTSNKATLDKLDILGRDHNIKLLSAKKTINQENLMMQILADKKEKAIVLQQSQQQCPLECEDIRNISEKIGNLQKSSHPGFVVAFDNIDIHQKRRNMTLADQNCDFHWVNHKMVENRVSGNHLDSQKPTADISDVKNITFLPNVGDNAKQRMDYIILTSRILTGYFHALEPLKEVCIKHISHKYVKEMSQKSKKVPLGVIFKNENRNEEILSVLQQFHTYLPKKWNNDYDGQLFAGDQLSIERAVNIIASVANGQTAEERLEGINLQLGDWHAAVKLLTLIYNRFYNGKSDGDSCTMFSDRTLLNRRNVTGDPHSSYRANRDFFLIVLKSRVIAAAMKVLGFESSTDKTIKPFLSQDLSLLSKSDKLKLLLDISAKVVDEFIFDKNLANSMIDSIVLQQEKDNVLKQQELTADGRFPCRFAGCNHSFKYNGKSRINHELSHDPPVEIPEHVTLSSSKPDSSKPKTNTKSDDVFNYNSALLTDGFLFHNFLDAISEGDGERIMRQYNYIMLYCWEDGCHSNKYALESLYQFFLTKALLSKRDSERFKWNRSVNNFCTKGTNIPLDLDVEHSNNFLKQGIKNLGPNVSEKAVTRICKAESCTRTIMDNIDECIHRVGSSGSHGGGSVVKDIDKLIERLKDSDVFNFDKAGHTYTHFCNFKRNRLENLNLSGLFKWINKHKKNVSLGIRAR